MLISWIFREEKEAKEKKERYWKVRAKCQNFYGPMLTFLSSCTSKARPSRHRQISLALPRFALSVRRLLLNVRLRLKVCFPFDVSICAYAIFEAKAAEVETKRKEAMSKRKV